MAITKDDFFKPGKISAQKKAEVTDGAARQIIALEADLRAKKTERLRLLRESREAEVVPPPPAAPARRRKAAAKPGV